MNKYKDKYGWIWERDPRPKGLIRHLDVKGFKNPSDTFKGGLVIGSAIGLVVGWTALATIIAYL